MLINSIKFVVFAALVVFLYYIVPLKKRKIVLLVSSYIFYFLSSKYLIVFILLSTLSIYLSGILIGKQDDLLALCEDKEKKKELKIKVKKRKKLILTLGILFNVGILLVLKYSNFFITTVNSIVKSNIPLVKFLLPLGISYYTLQAISYIADVYRGKYKPSKNIFEVSLFLIYFPIITEGPISRFDELAPQLYNGNKLKYENLINGGGKVLWGFFKKMVIADRCGIYVSSVFKPGITGLPILVGVVLYTIQLYAEFSGCIDIVSGLSETMGIKLPVNFERPFFSKSIQEFWRRWHKTLGAWLKDYVFYPVSLSKASMNVTKFARKNLSKNLAKFVPIAFSLFFVWFLNGFWHGASLKYIFYGLYYYIIMMVALLFKPLTDKLVELLKINTDSKGFKLFQIIRTCIFVFIGMLIFRSTSVKDAFVTLGSIFAHSTLRVTSFGLTKIDFLVIMGGVVLLFVYGILEEKGYNVIDKINNSNLALRYLIYFIIVFAIIIFGIYGPGYNASDFIYAQF